MGELLNRDAPSKMAAPWTFLLVPVDSPIVGQTGYIASRWWITCQYGNSESDLSGYGAPYTKSVMIVHTSICVSPEESGLLPGTGDLEPFVSDE